MSETEKRIAEISARAKAMGNQGTLFAGHEE